MSPLRKADGLPPDVLLQLRDGQVREGSDVIETAEKSDIFNQTLVVILLER